ncbi:hypothetical protein [Vreelandella lutescens]|uniref:Uncharacterized protein n=1 Tax=Vreelandella lutescens TaxID=1602943 RepID=A0ABQ1NRW3_9GAMM|nr:hypothetical protein [Halomonas lutescens]GGC83988.1 hypothetical protein GCM10011382_12710 [Halomonas lutescens]
MDNPDAVQQELQLISDEISDLIDIASEEGFKATNEHRERFKALKRCLEEGAKSGKLPGRTGAQTESEEYIYQPTLQNAVRNFNVTSTAAPDRWLDTLLDVQCSINTSLTKNQP